MAFIVNAASSSLVPLYICSSGLDVRLQLDTLIQKYLLLKIESIGLDVTSSKGSSTIVKSTDKCFNIPYL